MLVPTPCTSDSMPENKGKRKSMGRQKIEIKKIGKEANLQVTFSKRRKGLFKKVAELCMLCDVDAAVLVQSPGGKLFEFGNPSVENVVNRYLGLNMDDQNSLSGCSEVPTEVSDVHVNKYAECRKKLHAEKEIRKEKDEGGLFWWRKSTDYMELRELEEFKKALEGLKSEIMSRINQITEEMIMD